MDTERKQRWKITISGPTIKTRVTYRHGLIEEVIQFAAWSLWTDLRCKAGIGRAEIRDENDFLKATVKFESHGA